MLCWSRGLNFKGRNSSTRKHKNDVTEFEIKLPGYFKLFITLNQQAKKGVIVLAGIINPVCQEKMDGCCTVIVRESMSDTLENPGWILVLSHPVIELVGIYNPNQEDC